MNIFSARARYDGLAWIGEFKAADSSDYKAVQVNGVPARYPTREEAQMAADEALRGYLNGNLVRFGSKAERLTAAANAIFRKGKCIPVEVRRARA